MFARLRFAAIAGLMTLSALQVSAQFPPPPPPPPPPINGGSSLAHVTIERITRQPQGAWYRVSLRRAMTLLELQLVTVGSAAVVHEVSVVDERQSRFALTELAGSAVVPARQILGTRRLPNTRITVIDIRAESYGGVAAIEVRAESKEGRPQLSTGNDVPHEPPQRSDLSGFCDDVDHAQFTAAKAFAYSSDGLNYSTNDATTWALRYNETHACRTVNEFASRFTILKNVGYSSNGLNLTSADSVLFALRLVETTTTNEAKEMANTITVVKSWAYSSDGMNLTSADAASLASRWVQNRCENGAHVRMIAGRHLKEKDFAYSSDGLNMTSSDAVTYANRKVAPLTRCGHLISR